MMKRTILFFMLICVLAPGIITAQESVKVKSILDAPYNYRNDTVVVNGSVTHYGEDSSDKKSRSYYLKDDYGYSIKVVANIELPEVNTRAEVRGIVVIDDRGDISLIEQGRNISGPTTVEPPVVTDGESRGKLWLYVLIGLGALLVIILVILAIIMNSNKKMTGTFSSRPSSFDKEFDIPEPMETMEGDTIKITIPPPETLVLLPGRFKVESGDDIIKEIRFYKSKKQENAETTFGRDPGPNYSHIQLKPMTISKKQAKVVWKNGKYTLINYSNTNPTKVNDAPMEKEGNSILENGYRIEMGEVVFTFLEK